MTGEPNELMAPIHDRMAVILPEEAWPKWLGEEPTSPEDLKELLQPFPAERMKIYSISMRVNSVKNDDAGLIEPMMTTVGLSA